MPRFVSASAGGKYAAISGNAAGVLDAVDQADPSAGTWTQVGSLVTNTLNVTGTMTGDLEFGGNEITGVENLTVNNALTTQNLLVNGTSPQTFLVPFVISNFANGFVGGVPKEEFASFAAAIAPADGGSFCPADGGSFCLPFASEVVGVSASAASSNPFNVFWGAGDSLTMTYEVGTFDNIGGIALPHMAANFTAIGTAGTYFNDGSGLTFGPVSMCTATSPAVSLAADQTIALRVTSSTATSLAPNNAELTGCLILKATV